MTRRAASAAAGAAAGVGACLVVAGALDPSTRRDLTEAAVTVAAAVPLAVLAPFRGWGAKRLTPETLARFARAYYVEDGHPIHDVWTFALTRNTGIVWLRGVRRPGQERRFGSAEGFRPTVKLRDIFGGDS